MVKPSELLNTENFAVLLAGLITSPTERISVPFVVETVAPPQERSSLLSPKTTELFSGMVTLMASPVTEALAPAMVCRRSPGKRFPCPGTGVPLTLALPWTFRIAGTACAVSDTGTANKSSHTVGLRNLWDIVWGVRTCQILLWICLKRQ